MAKVTISSKFVLKKAEKNSVSLESWHKMPNFVEELARKGVFCNIVGYI